MLRIHLFGQPRFFYSDEPLRLNARPKILPLLAYLLVTRARRTSRETLAFTLWSDDSESGARANLRRHLYELQRILPPTPPERPWLLSSSEGVQWNPNADYWLDIAEFERLSESPGSLEQAVQLYTGDLVENVYEDWMFYERERLRDLCFADLGRLWTQYRAQGDYAKAIYFVQELLNRDPLREDALRELVTIKYEAGDRAGALKAYEVFSRKLRAELAVDPMPETEALYENIVRNARLSVQDRPETIEIAAAPPPSYHIALPFVGRMREMESLRAWWSRAARGHGGLVLVGGEAGIGKSRLATELANLAEMQGARVLRGTTAFTEPLPYQSITEALRSALPMLAGSELDLPTLSALAALLPELHSRRSNLPGLPTLDAEHERTRLYQAIATALQTLAHPRPLLLILEDLHWAGAATAALVEFLTMQASQHSLLILVTYREEEVPRAHPLRVMRQHLQRERLLGHIALSRLSASAVTRIVEQMSGNGTDATELARSVYSASEGNPLFVNELIRDWVESGNIIVQEGRWRVGTFTGSELPHGVAATVTDRVARLSGESQTLAELAAVVGPAFEIELVRQVSGWHEAQLLDALEELLMHQIVREIGARSPLDYAFTHHLIQAIIYQNISNDKRVHRHRLVAHAIEKLYPEQLDELSASLAEHFERGQEFAHAPEYYMRAARHAESVYAHDEALNFYERAHQCAELAHDSEQLCAVEEGMALVYDARAEYHRAAACYEHALEYATDPEKRALLNAKLGCAYSLDGDSRCIQVLTAVIQELDPTTQGNALGEAMIWLGRWYSSRGGYPRALELMKQGLTFAEPYDDPRVLNAAYLYLSNVHRQMMLLEQAIEWGRRCISLGERKNRPRALAKGYELLAENFCVMGRWQETLDLATRELKIAEQIGAPEQMFWAECWRAEALWGKGKLADALACARSAQDLSKKMGSVHLQDWAIVIHSMIESEMGGFEVARSELNFALARDAQTNALVRRFGVNGALAYFHLQQHDWEPALAYSDKCAEFTAATKNRLLTLRMGAYFAEAYWGVGRLKEASRMVSDHLALAREAHSTFQEAVALRVWGQIFTDLEAWDDAGAALNEAIEILDATHSRLEFGRALYRRALLSQSRGAPSAAAQDAARARLVFLECGAAPDLQRADKLVSES